MPRTPTFYFGSILFFVGLVLFAAGVSGVIGKIFTILTIAELISGFILMVVGYRSSRPTPSSTS